MKIPCYELSVSWDGTSTPYPYLKFSSKKKAEKYIEDFHKKNNYYPAWRIDKIEVEIL